MKDKIYFKPETTKKKIPNTKKTKDNRKTILKLILFLVLIMVVILTIVWFLRGKTEVLGQFPESIKNESLTCISQTAIPPKIDSIDSDSKETKINAIFNGDESLKSISFTYSLVFENEDNAYGAEAKSHAFFNQALSASGYQINKFNNKFTRYDNRLLISIHANESEIDAISAPFFMIKTNNYEVTIKTMDDYRKNYESQGFSCDTSKE